MSNTPNIDSITARVLPNGDAIIGKKVYKIVKPEVLADIHKKEERIRDMEQGLEAYDKRHDADQSAIKLTLNQTNVLKSQLATSQERVLKLQEFAIWLTGCGYDFCQHEHFIQQRDELLVDKPDSKEE